jgi:hypothetical protein
VCEVQTRWQSDFATERPTWLTIACMHDKFEADGTVHDVHKQRSGRSCTATSLASSAVVLEQFMITAKVRKTMCTMGVSHFSFNRMAHHHWDVKNYLNEILPGQWIRWRGSVEYPPWLLLVKVPEGGISQKTTNTGDVMGRNWNVVCRYSSGHLGHSCSCTSPSNSEVSIS